MRESAYNVEFTTSLLDAFIKWCEVESIDGYWVYAIRDHLGVETIIDLSGKTSFRFPSEGDFVIFMLKYA